MFRKKEIKNSVNAVPYSFAQQWFGFQNVTRRRYADAYLWMILNKIFAGIRNVNFHANEKSFENDTKELCEFLDTNVDVMLWWLWSFGYIVVSLDKNGALYIPQQSSLMFDTLGNITNYDIVYYSDKYRFSRKSDFAIIKENIDNLDSLKNADSHIINSLGALGILCGKGVPMNYGEKEDLQKEMRENYGITDKKFNIFFSSQEIDFKQINLPIADLQINEKIREELKFLAGYFNVPYDLIPFSGQSTYANQRQAIIDFYRNCISPLAEVVLKIGRYVIKKDRSLLIPSDALTFSIDNVPELEDDRGAELDYKTKLVELITKMQAIGIDTTNYITELNETRK